MRVTPAARHPQVQAPGRARAIHVQLDEGGGIAGLAGLAPERVAGLWTFRDWKKNSFPFVQLKSSLLDAVDAAQTRTAIPTLTARPAPSGQTRRG